MSLADDPTAGFHAVAAGRAVAVRVQAVLPEPGPAVHQPAVPQPVQPVRRRPVRPDSAAVFRHQPGGKLHVRVSEVILLRHATCSAGSVGFNERAANRDFTHPYTYYYSRLHEVQSRDIEFTGQIYLKFGQLVNFFFFFFNF